MTWLYNQARWLPDEIIESHIVCEQTANLGQFGIERIHCWPGRNPLYSALARLVQIASRGSPAVYHVAYVARRVHARVLHSHFGNQAWLMLDAARRAALRHVVTFYGYDLNMLPRVEPLWRERYRALFAAADLFLCEGPSMADALVELGCPRPKVRVHPLGVEIGKLPFRERRRSPDEPMRVLIAGTFREKKGIPDALEAVGRVVGQGADIRVSVIGDVTHEQRDLDEKNRIMAIIDRFGLGARVKMLGFQAHASLVEAYYQHDLFLSPSVTAANGDTEGGAPVTIIEAAATGLPVVTTNHCDIPFVLGGERGGFLAAEHDVVKLSDHLASLHDAPDMAKERVVVARRNVELQHDCFAQGRALARIYAELEG